MALVSGIPVDYFQHAGVGIRLRVIVVNPFIVRISAEHFAVSRIGEALAVGNLYLAALVPVADHISVG